MSTLYIVGTPIGNLKDVTIRALEVLNNADIIACEDTRHSKIFLTHYEISKPLVSYHKFNENERSEELLSKIESGLSVALITDAGMPGVSDPGAVIVRKARDRGIDIAVVPGPSAVTSAIARAGITASGFTFLGFLPEKQSEIKKLLERHSSTELPLIFYSAPHNVTSDIKTLYKHLGNRRITAVKELTKIHETAEDGFLEDFVPSNLKGEFVLIVEGGKAENPLNALPVLEHIIHYVQAGLTKKDAVKAVAADLGVPKNEIYKQAIDLDV